MDVMEKAKQFETTLVATFATCENGAQKAVDTFAQHAAAPGAVEYLTQGLPGLHQGIQTQPRNGYIQT